MKKSFKDELNQVDDEFKRKQRILDIVTFFILCAAISAIYLLITI